MSKFMLPRSMFIDRHLLETRESVPNIELFLFPFSKRDAERI